MKLHFKPNKKQLFELIFLFLIVVIFIAKACSGAYHKSPIATSDNAPDSATFHSAQAYTDLPTLWLWPQAYATPY